MSANKSKSEFKDGEIDKNILDFEDDQSMTKDAVVSQSKLKKIC